MAGDQENLEKQLQDAMEKLMEGERREQEAEEREKKLKDELKGEQNVRGKLEGELRNVKEELQTKDAQLRKFSTGKSGFPIEGRFLWEVEMEKTLADISEDDMIFSPYNDICGRPFRIGCKTEMRDGEKWLSFCLCCNDNVHSETYSAGVVFTLRVLSPTRPKSWSHSGIFPPSLVKMGWLTIERDFSIDPKNGRIHNGHITIEAQIKVIFYHKNSIADFTRPDPDLSDLILLVGGKVFNTSRNYLAHYCGYFKAYYNFAEKNKDVIKLDDIDPDEFEEMLRVIYPERKKVTAATVKSLLRLADFFDVDTVIRKCAKFLKTSTDLSVIAKLEIAEEFRLQELQFHLVVDMKKMKETRAVIYSSEFEKFSIFLRNSILEKHFMLSLLT